MILLRSLFLLISVFIFFNILNLKLEASQASVNNDSSNKATRTITFPILFENIMNKSNYFILVEAYKKIGFSVQIPSFPTPMARALDLANSGELDGEISRIDGISKKFTNLIKVPISLIDMEMVAITSRGAPKINGVQDLSNYTVAIERGFKDAEILAKRAKSVYPVSSNQQLVGLIQLNRSDAIITDKLTATKILSQFSKVSLEINGPVLKLTPLYHYLHKKNRHLLKDITRSLREMRDSGEMEDLKQKIISQRLFDTVKSHQSK